MAEPRLFRVVLQVGDVDEAARFYATLLDLPGVRVSDGRHYFDCGGTILAAFDSQREDGFAPRPHSDHVYIAVDELEAAHARAREAGAEPDEIATQPWGERCFYLRDLWGNPLCVVDRPTMFTGT
jgi:catechol 2,3-dioxygenase-like lactoylglutathione lyase family enzyme